MSGRLRTIAAAPARGTSETWETIRKLVLDTLSRSKSIDLQAAKEELAALAPAARMLVAGGHLEVDALVLVAPPLHLSISTVSGSEAFDVEENLNPVPGAGAAETWALHVPAPEPLRTWVATAVRDRPHLTTEPAPGPSQVEKEAESDPRSDGRRPPSIRAHAEGGKMSRTAVATREQTNTRTQTATYLAEVILGAVADIVGALGLDPSKLDIQDIERAILIRLTEQSMEKLVLECYTPADGIAHEVLEFPVQYSSDGAVTRFTADRATLAVYRAKLRMLPKGCAYRVVVAYVNGTTPTQVVGWGTTTLRSTEGMQSRVFGTLGSAPNATVSMRYLYRR